MQRAVLFLPSEMTSRFIPKKKRKKNERAYRFATIEIVLMKKEIHVSQGWDVFSNRIWNIPDDSDVYIFFEGATEDISDGKKISGL